MLIFTGYINNHDSAVLLPYIGTIQDSPFPGRNLILTLASEYADLSPSRLSDAEVGLRQKFSTRTIHLARKDVELFRLEYIVVR